ncbi:pyruvate dehydrogenase complex dihydrolipoamide acetyltransferase component (E2) [Orbilia oligospora]|uniref:Acetyltransferase component of pyruvate dehydrogenase complex n=1 Tax=Orbilia oligospora TaxID=2813651 RepID=A0A7C8PGC3_ORBOL|nr:pyruvate dehydrogenase complex dihydrolipoamide acetyltransferase component (E2) [Orbilia oligospora]KAF3171036.1 pyruvate dehydrogenase complex dihydrolipoamide acetyltransferase component (E2) [Orbilia oligospora]KAF3242515.1 pyruvate dehydrogenase complex dihydrolipoamide acetyltransferase component (E2) [Orbilia oligospora]KAF3253644.1 pyruvate dehydrogenase complex dihydrolipoamide acetyltransferase component (E2) [Orbilia oligospora]KAF3286557.1 pyruvate dehydrogenase complex dihydroli
MVAAVFSSRTALLASRAVGRVNSTTCLRSIPRAAFPTFTRYYADKSSLPRHTVVNMPALSPTMTAGNIGGWQKQAGDKIVPGDVLVEIETDKAQMDFEYQEEGVLAKILLQTGEKDVGVGSPIAVMVDDAGDVEAFKDFTIDDAGGKASSTPESKSSSPEPSKSESESQPAPAPSAEESTSTGSRLQTSLERLEGLEYAASPAAKVLALEKGIPLKNVKGTGPNGRIVKADVEKYSGSAGGPSASAAIGGATGLSDVDIPLSGMRKSIATRLQSSMQTSPHFYIGSDISVSKLLKLRTALNASAQAGEYKLSVNDLIVKAVAVALKRHPNVNASWVDSESVIRQYASVDISVAVATPVGLITPIVKAAHAKGLQTISNEIKELATRAKDGKLKPEEYQGGTFTISNMGMNDAVSRFTAIINPPHAGILSVSAPSKVAVPGRDGGIEWDDKITFTGSFDHRIVDGVVGAEFMKTLKRVVENPMELLL